MKFFFKLLLIIYIIFILNRIKKQKGGYKNKTYQLFYLEESIKEQLIKNKDLIIENIDTDHLKGVNYINNIKIPLTFPLYLVNYIDKQNKIKTLDYNFIGKITNNRDWINKYNKGNSLIKKSLNGRKKNLGYNIDEKYYKILCKSKFTLTPVGDCNWSYRFFEAILCLSIPILEDNSKDIFCKDYFYFYDNEKHIYSKKKCIKQL